MSTPTTVLLKITGEAFLSKDKKTLDIQLLQSVAQQIRAVADTHRFGIVIGGGNFFRGNKQGKTLGITPSIGHQIGMLATTMNGLLIKDVFEREGVCCTLFCAVPSPEIGIPISQQAINISLSKGKTLIFTGGTGNPFFTTDTTSILRALQIGAGCVWKGTSVDGIYTADPVQDPQAMLLKKVTYRQALLDNLRIMDATAFALAQEHDLCIRVFNIFEKDAIISATKNNDFGSRVE